MSLAHSGAGAPPKPRCVVQGKHQIYGSASSLGDKGRTVGPGKQEPCLSGFLCEGSYWKRPFKRQRFVTEFPAISGTEALGKNEECLTGDRINLCWAAQDVCLSEPWSSKMSLDQLLKDGGNGRHGEAWRRGNEASPVWLTGRCERPQGSSPNPPGHCSADHTQAIGTHLFYPVPTGSSQVPDVKK